MSTETSSDHATPEQARAFLHDLETYDCRYVSNDDMRQALRVIRTLEAALRDVVEATDKESKWRDRLTREPTHRNLREWEAWTKLLQDRITHAAALLGTKDTGVK